ncbi:strawberry notch-like NTP hydrolase domain-containing protein [Ruegeria sp. ANG-R]|uniref:strawberry notch-like NTP hydrolase domain-containing protein n=1 Tax=Ruegeria sp. ANG-R TaxID=1577903 RepID=UPI000AD0DF09|nr:strawberry notch family protein [Ruegeria sp. ANG-R]
MIPAAQTRRLINSLKKLIATNTLDTGQLSRCMTDAFGGTDASGAWDWRLALDMMQVAAGRSIQIDPANPRKTLAGITALMAGLPTETRRSERQLQLQQFSTPLDLSFVAAQAALICETDVVLEPSAGTGSLAIMTSASSATLHLNELDDQRRSLLAIASGQAVTGHDAEFIADLIDEGVSPTVVLMNPPFASSATRSDKTIAARHVLSAAKALRDGGRLVAIVPPSVSMTGDAGLWRRICAVATPVLRLHLPRAAFRKMGTSVSTDLLVLDKMADGQGAACIEHSCSDLVEALTVVQDRCPKRSEPATPAPSKSGPAAFTRVPKPVGCRKMLLPGRSSVDTNALAPIDFEIFFEPCTNAPVSDVYADYAPQRIQIEGAQDHPSPLVESLAMGSDYPPCPSTDGIKLPKKLVEEGLLSEAQLETVLMAETSFSNDLPGRFLIDPDGAILRNDEAEGAVAFRQGYFLGDGTGCGKGRQVAGIVMANWLAGRRKAVWLSKSASLIEDAVRDWTDIGGGQSDIHSLSRWKPDEEINLTQGILFVTYATLRSVGQSGARRLDQILRWLGEGFEGVIGFDESHEMQNAWGGKSTRGVKAASQQGLAGLQLQNALPRARVLYVSATGATGVGNLAYATRLGLWGQGADYAFPSRESFINAMESGGVAAMEVVARDLKALGLYTARALSFKGVEYEILEHSLTDDQVEI